MRRRAFCDRRAFAAVMYRDEICCVSFIARREGVLCHADGRGHSMDGQRKRRGIVGEGVGRLPEKEGG